MTTKAHRKPHTVDYVVEMIDSLLKHIWPFLLISTFANARTQDMLKNEFSGGSPYYEIRTSKIGHKFFVVGPGPCACATFEPKIDCVDKIKETLEAQLLQKSDIDERNKKCLPNAGCVAGKETIFAECSKNIKNNDKK